MTQYTRWRKCIVNSDFEFFEIFVGKACDDVAQKIKCEKDLSLCITALADMASKSESEFERKSIYAAIGRLVVAYKRNAIKEETT